MHWCVLVAVDSAAILVLTTACCCQIALDFVTVRQRSMFSVLSCAALRVALQVNKNATSLANRFKSLGGLKLLLSQEMTAISNHQASCLKTLRQLQAEVGRPDGPGELMIEQAGQCGRCR